MHIQSCQRPLQPKPAFGMCVPQARTIDIAMIFRLRFDCCHRHGTGALDLETAGRFHGRPDGVRITPCGVPGKSYTMHRACCHGAQDVIPHVNTA